MAAQVAFTSGPPSASPVIAVNLTQPGLVKPLADSFTLGAPDWEGDPLTGIGVFGTRQVELTAQITGTYQQASALAQSISRLIGQAQRTWLMFRWSQADDPMFAMVYPSQMQPLEWRSGGVEVWNLPITLTCDAALWGPVESGSVTINNDPVSGTNPLFWRIGTGVKGDLETPLFISTTTAADMNGRRTVLAASSSLRYGLSQTSPYIVQLPPASGISSIGTFTSGSGDAAMSGGNYYRYTSTGAGAQTTQIQWTSSGQIMVGNPIGDYRVFVRYRSSAPGDDWQIRLTQYDASAAAVVGDWSTVGGGNTAAWLDLGVFRFPLGAPTVDTAFGTTPASAGTRIFLDLSLPAGSVAGDTFDLDTLMFVPVGLDQAAANHLAMVTPPPTTAGTSHSYVLDGVSDRAYLQNSSGTLGTSGIPSYIGSMPTVVPGCDNSLTWLRTVSIGNSTAVDAISASTVLNWQYWPRYLHARPSGT